MRSANTGISGVVDPYGRVLAESRLFEQAVIVREVRFLRDATIYARTGDLFAYGSVGADVAIIEGTMGLYDGLAGRTDAESTAQLAGLLRAPVVLVVDVAAMGQSVAALAHGFRAYDELLWLGGVILNRVASDRHEDLLRESLDEIGVPVLGALRQRELPRSGLPARTEGVVPVVHHSVSATRAVRHLGEVIAGGVDIDRLLAVARSAPRLVAEVTASAAIELALTPGRNVWAVVKATGSESGRRNALRL